MINRSKMRRQLYMGGGIAGIYPRKKFGLGSDIKDRFRKLIPNELADVAAKAAPVVAPFSPATAALMRGIGRFDKRGSISDALKQGALTYGFGVGARKLGGAENVYGDFGFSSPLSPEKTQGIRKLFKAKELSEADKALKVAKDADSIKNTPAFMQRATEATIGKVPGLRALPPMVQQKLLVSGAISGATALASYFKGEFREQEEGESMKEYLAARKDVVGKQMRIYMDNYFKFDPEYSQLDDAGRNAFVARHNVAQGGRIGYRMGTPEAGIKSLEAGASDITYEGNEGPQAPMKMAFDDTPGFELKDLDLLIDEYKQDNNGRGPVSIDDLRRFFYNKYGPDGISKVDQATKDKQMAKGPVIPSDEDPINPFAPKPTGPVLPDKMMAAKGGRIGQMIGTGPNGLPGIPRMAPDGMEFDMRQNGGFQPLGAKEKKDDVPAMLAKNEFVFTADAVRGAGNGNIELGAQRMYDTMKNLEKRVV